MMRHRPVVGIDASRSYRTPMTGTERYSRRLIEHLVQHDHDPVRYRLYFSEPPPLDAVLPGVEIRSMTARRFWTHYRLSREMRENPIDLLFIPSHVLPVIHPKRSVVTVHDLGYLYEPEAHTLGSQVQLRLTTRWNVRQASHIIAVSRATKNDLVQRYGVPKSRISVVPHGVENQIRILPEDEVEHYRRAARLPIRFVLYLGTVQPRKNLLRLIEAFETIARHDPDLHLVIGGRTGWKAEPIKRRIESSAQRDRIRMLGYVPEPQLPLLYNAATTVALPSLYEGFGLPALEGMACGLPVVVSNRGALPELAGADSVIVDPLDADELARGIQQALAHRSDPERIAQRIEHARRFRWDESARATRHILLRELGIEPGGDT